MQHNITLTEQDHQVSTIPAELEAVATQSGMQKATEYAATFAPFMMRVHELSQKAAGINKTDPTSTDAKIAREVRLAMVKNRTATATKKDESKAALLAESNLIQNLHNVVINTSQIIEAELTEVEKHAERKEAARIETIRQERAEALAPFVEDAAIFPLGTMTADAFTALLDGQRMAHEAKIEAARLAEEAAIKAEAERLAEQERIKAENARLKAEAEAAESARLKTERLAKIEADRLEAEAAAERKRAADEAARVEAEHKAKLAAIELANAKAREKAAQEQKARDDKAAAELKAAKDHADKVAAELKAKNDAYEAEQAAKRKLEADALAAAKKVAKLPDADKIRKLIESLPTFNIECKTDEGKAIAAIVSQKFEAFKVWALTKVQVDLTGGKEVGNE